MLLLGNEQRKRGVIAASAGNHAQGLSYHGTRLGIPVTIVMPRTTPTVKVMQTESVGGKVVLEGESFDEAYAHARTAGRRAGADFRPPVRRSACRRGQGTVALEMLEDVPDLDMLAIPVGGGGLASGMGTAARAIARHRPDRGGGGTVPLDVQPAQGHEYLPSGGDTLAEGIACQGTGRIHLKGAGRPAR
jgi:threonine dehydratase